MGTFQGLRKASLVYEVFFLLLPQAKGRNWQGEAKTEEKRQDSGS